jgi:hypothetical protein
VKPDTRVDSTTDDAIGAGHADIIAMLLLPGADANAHSNGTTALLLAADHGMMQLWPPFTGRC